VIRDNALAGYVFNSGNEFAVAILTGDTPEPPFPLVVPRIVIQGNQLLDNIVGIACLFNTRSQVVANRVIGGRLGFNGIAVSGDRNHVVGNHIDMRDSVLPGSSGIALLGLEFGGAAGFGMATDTKVTGNRILGGDLPVWEQSGVVGTRMHGNHLSR
jgi:hypothetical protein